MSKSCTLCSICEKEPATCIGAYEGAEEDTAACDDCCSHDYCDGSCEPLVDAYDDVERLMGDPTMSPLTAREIAKRLPIRVPVAIVARICFDLVSLGKFRNATGPRQRAVRFLRR